jgi:hypothetical protein
MNDFLVFQHSHHNKVNIMINPATNGSLDSMLLATPTNLFSASVYENKYALGAPHSAIKATGVPFVDMNSGMQGITTSLNNTRNMIEQNYNFSQVSNLAVPADFSPAAPAHVGHRAMHLATVSGRARGGHMGASTGGFVGGPMRAEAQMAYQGLTQGSLDFSVLDGTVADSPAANNPELGVGSIMFNTNRYRHIPADIQTVAPNMGLTVSAIPPALPGRAGT